jgi:hypothetical protein
MDTQKSDFKDISELERAFYFSQQFKSGVFKNQNEMAKAMGVSQGLISRMIKAAELMEYDWLKKLFRKKIEIKIKPAYKLANMLKNTFQKNKIQEVASVLETRINSGERLTTKKILKILLEAGSVSLQNIQQEILYPIGEAHQVLCKRDARGRLTFIFEGELSTLHRDTLVDAMKDAIDQLIFQKK